MSFQKKDLKTGDVVTLRNKEKYVVLKNTTIGDVISKWSVSSDGKRVTDFEIIHLSDYSSKKLAYGFTRHMSPLDIVIVRRPKTEEGLASLMIRNDLVSKVMFCGGKVALSAASMQQVKELISKGYKYIRGDYVRVALDSGEHGYTYPLPELKNLDDIWFNLHGLALGLQGDDGYKNVIVE